MSLSTREDHFLPHDGQVEAVQLLMAMNRQIYLACPEVPSLGLSVPSIGCCAIARRKGTLGVSYRLCSLIGRKHRLRLSVRLAGQSSKLLPEDQNPEQNEPCQSHNVPEPCRGIDSDLPRLNTLEAGEGKQAKEQGPGRREPGGRRAVQ